MRSLEWPAQMSPCLQIFIASLHDDSTANVTHEIQRLPSALVLAAENGPVRDEGVGYAHKLIATEMADAVIRYDGRAVRVGRRSWKHLELTGSKRSEGRDIIMKYEAMASELKTTPIMFTVLLDHRHDARPGKGSYMAQTNASTAVRNIVLVHGGFVDGSGWAGVYKALKKNGHAVTIVQNSTTSLADDVATTKRAIAMLNGPVILVGHSYGGAVITEAGNDPKVAGLVYIAAFAPDRGESVSSLIKSAPAGAPVPPILPPVDGYLMLDKAKFPASFAGDVSPEEAAFMADSQVPWGVNALGGTISEPAWRAKPSWYLLTTEDKMIPPDAQRQMSKRAGATVVEVKGSHAVYVSQPQAVAHIIEQAATSALVAGKAKSAASDLGAAK